MKRFLPFLIIALVGVVTVGVAALVYRTKMKTTPASAVTTATPPGESEDPSLHVRGPANAPVTLEIYGDFQCPPCGTATKVIDELQKEYGNKMRLIFHEYPLEVHNHATEAAMAAEAAAVQGKFWEMHDMLYQFQSVWSRVSNAKFFFESYAESLKLDVARFRADCQAADLRLRIMNDGKIGESRGVKNTPTIFINGTEAKVFTKDKLKEAIDAALAGKKGS